MTTPDTPSRRDRIVSVDLLRGIVMIIMLLDHTREYVNADAFLYSPTDLSKTSVALFFTRWVTHFCAPTFVFLAGVSIYLQKIRGKSGAELTKFLLARGLWLIILEFTVVRFALFFDLDYSLLGIAEVIWVFGVSMLVMALLVRLPVWASAAFGLVLIFGHNILDTLGPAPSMAGGGVSAGQILWTFLHQPGFVPLGATKLFVAYPLLPWIGVMSAGYALGKVYEWESDRRKRVLMIMGATATAAFIVIRFANVYGDPSPWASQPRSGFTLLSFLNTTKYPASLLFLLMTLGPALLFLGVTDRSRGTNFAGRIAVVFGRVPLFYFVLQLVVAHLAGVILGYFAGFDVGFWFTNYPFSDTVKAPEGFGFSLVTTYAAWIVGLIVLYPLCVWYGNVKRRSGHWIFSYL